MANGAILSQHDAAGTSYFLSDALGSTRALTDEAGSISSAYDYDAFGELTAGSDPVGTDYLFTGQQYDASTELYSLRARYYSPSMGRFLSQDTWATNFRDPMEYNRYAYAANNPATFRDPSGNAALLEYKETHKPSEKVVASQTNSYALRQAENIVYRADRLYYAQYYFGLTARVAFVLMEIGLLLY